MTVSLGAVRPAAAEEQPKMQAALVNLQQAKQNLQDATHDKGGHRVKALASVNEAIEQVKAGIAYDNKH
ncbi:MAG: hypothetical protein JST00_37415 [Deltaproteobacteria bacterium]|nr:hypothetical protein [Deltaproteobacteria bacterium]